MRRSWLSRGLWFPVALLLVVLVASCMDQGDGAIPAGRTANPYIEALNTPAAKRFQVAKGCYIVQDRASGAYLTGMPQGQAAFDAQGGEALRFRFQPTALGRYALYDAERRFLSLTRPLDEAAPGAATALLDVGVTVSAIGDALSLVTPIAAAGDAIDAVGENLSATGNELTAAITNAGPVLLALTDAPMESSEWQLDELPSAAFELTNTATGALLSAYGGQAGLQLMEADGCPEYPEAELNASGQTFSGLLPDGSVYGFAETHMHLGGSRLGGGRLAHGQPFHKYGIPHALSDCDEVHGPEGALGFFDSAVNPDRTLPMHSTQGWPAFTDWPTSGGQIHHQTYYMWLKRAWLAGQRLMVNFLVTNEPLCVLYPLKQNDCDEMVEIDAQLRQVHALEDYIDAQSGGPGRGFFRIVHSAQQARQVIEAGLLAVVLGTETDAIFGCKSFFDQPNCSMQTIEHDLDEWYAKGVRVIFPTHLFDNAFGGAAVYNDPALYTVFNLGNVMFSGHPFALEDCGVAEESELADPHDQGLIGAALLMLTNPTLPPPGTAGCRQNARGLTRLGAEFVNLLVDRGVMVATDHMGTKQAREVLELTQQRGVPVLAGHVGSSARPDPIVEGVIQSNGVVGTFPDVGSPDLIARFEDYLSIHVRGGADPATFAIALGSDVNGVHRQAPPRDDVQQRPLAYPYTSVDGQMVFDRQVTGDRVFDLNVDGVAHYGLLPDYIADIASQPGGDAFVNALFRSAEAFLVAWERVEAAALNAAEAGR